MGRETDTWPFIQARFYSPFPKGQRRVVAWIVIHDEEYPELEKSAENVAVYFRDMPDGRSASAHVTVDVDSVVQCVHDNDIAYGAPGANTHGIHIELSGYQRQTREQWLDDYGVKMLTRAANVVAQYCVKYEISPEHLTDDQLESGMPGIIGHDQVTRVFKQGDHTDPGPNFPWDFFLEQIALAYNTRLTTP